jgi:hypothetical protein
MCFPIIKQKTIEEIIAANSAGMTDDQKAQYAYELDQQTHRLLTTVLDIETFTIDCNIFQNVARAQYPTFTDFQLPDGWFTITTQAGLKRILAVDWTNKVPYVSETMDCDKFADMLYLHLCQYYGINGVIEVWGQTDKGFHGFNLAVLKEADGYIARLVEPQTDSIFIDQGPLGTYQPQVYINKLAVLK